MSSYKIGAQVHPSFDKNIDVFSGTRAQENHLNSSKGKQLVHYLLWLTLHVTDKPPQVHVYLVSLEKKTALVGQIKKTQDKHHSTFRKFDSYFFMSKLHINATEDNCIISKKAFFNLQMPQNLIIRTSVEDSIDISHVLCLEVNVSNFCGIIL